MSSTLNITKMLLVRHVQPAVSRLMLSYFKITIRTAGQFIFH